MVFLYLEEGAGNELVWELADAGLEFLLILPIAQGHG